MDKNDRTFYRCSEHPSIIYTSLEKVRVAAAIHLKLVGIDFLDENLLEVELGRIEEWDGSFILEVFGPTCCLIQLTQYEVV